MTRIPLAAGLVIVCLLVAAAPAVAHRSFAAEFDAIKRVDLTGYAYSI
jgi:hypothetical protein